MFKQAFSLVTRVYAFVSFAVSQVEIALAGKSGPEKKAAALELVSGWVKQYLPSWVAALVTGILGWLIDQAVAYANGEGVFVHSSDPIGPLSPL